MNGDGRTDVVTGNYYDFGVALALPGGGYDATIYATPTNAYAIAAPRPRRRRPPGDPPRLGGLVTVHSNLTKPAGTSPTAPAHPDAKEP